nr:MAG TPA: Prohibitin-2 [Caudoviricetes sp.]
MSERFSGAFLGTVVVWAIMIVVFGGLYGCPRYNVWQQEMSGKAEFAKAEQNRRIKIEEAKANLEAEKLNAQAEVERAKGAAEAIKIENGSITPAYIQYLWVRQQNNLNDKTVIYIPTETNLPVLEASRVKGTNN